MRNLIVSVATSALIVSASFSAECTNVDTLFPMEEISGNVGNTLEVVNGKVNSAIKFDGKSYINKGNVEDVGTGDFTIVSFVRTNANRLSQSIVDKRENGKGYHLFLNSPGTSSSTLAFELNGVNFGSPNTTQINNNQWHCVAVSVERNSNTGGKLYIDPQDGINIGSNYHEFDPTVVNGDSTNGANLLIGGTQPNYSFSSNFEGIIDEVGFHNSVLTPDEIACLCGKEDRVDENDLPLIPLDDSTFTIEHKFDQGDPYLKPELELTATNGVYENIQKNKLIPLTITSINIKDTNLSSDDDSVYFKQDGDFVYVAFSKSGEFNVKVEGFDLKNNIMSSDRNFTTLANSAPIANSGIFNINSNEVLKFDANSYFSDSDGDILAFHVEANTSKGKLQINNNIISYYPEQASYSDEFKIKAIDTDGVEAIATFSIKVEFVSDIEIAYGWNLLGNSLPSRDISTSAILEGEEVIYRFSDSGFWELSNLTYNEQFIKPTEGFWIKAENDRYLAIKGDNAFQENIEPKTLHVGWNLLAETEEKPLRNIKAGFEQVFVYDKKNNTWLNSTTNPNFTLPKFQGYWGKIADNINNAPDTNVLNLEVTSTESGINLSNTVGNINTPFEFYPSENVTFNLSNILGSDIDGDGVTLTISSNDLILNETKIDTNTTSITFTTPDTLGSYSFNIQLSDSYGLPSEVKTFQVDVVEIPNVAPNINLLNANVTSTASGVNFNNTINTIPNPLEIYTNESVTFNFSNILGTDIDVANGDIVTLSIDNSANNLTLSETQIDANNTTLTLTAPSTVGDYSFDVIVTDLEGASTFRTVDFNVSKTDITRGLIAFYEFENNSAIDTIGAHNALASNLTYDVGKLNDGGVFSSSQFITPITETYIHNNYDQISISVWFKANSVSGYGITDGQRIMSTYANNFDIIVNNDYSITFNIFDGTAHNSLTSSGNIFSLGDWVHIVAIYDTSVGMRLYVNNEEFSNDIKSKPTTSIYNIHFGTTGFSPSLFFDGMIDQIRFYDKALTFSEVQAVYNFEK